MLKINAQTHGCFDFKSIYPRTFASSAATRGSFVYQYDRYIMKKTGVS